MGRTPAHDAGKHDPRAELTMRIRTIKPEFWSHPVMVRQSDATKLLAIGLLNYADDEGFFYADAKLVRASLRPLDEDSTIIRASLDVLSRIGFIECREHSSHGPIGRVTNFTQHQRVDRPSKSKIRPFFDSCEPQDPPEAEVTLFDDHSTRARRTLVKNATQEQGTGNREQGNEGTGKGTGAAPAAGGSELPTDSVLPETLDTPEFKAAWADWLAYRRERKIAAYKPTSLRTQLATLAEWGHDAAIVSIRDSIRQQWQGLFEPKAVNRVAGSSPVHTKAPTAADHAKGFFHGV